MGKLDKFKVIFNAVSPLAKMAIPGVGGTAVDAVSQILNGGSASPTSAQVATELSEEIDAMAKAMLALHERNEAQEARITALEINGK